MKAAFFESHGNIDNIKIGSIDLPQFGLNDVLVESAYGGLNHLDIFVIQGWPGLNLPLPHILGSDGAGIIKEVGSSVSNFKKGDHVLINPGISCGKCYQCLSGNQNLCDHYSIKGEHHWGTFAEYFSVPESNLMKVPEDYPLDQAAAAPLNFLTAWRMLVTKAQIKPNDYVFIHGAGGGVATAAIQIAKLFNAIVITSTSTDEKMEKAEEIGADYIFNYKDQPDFPKSIYKDITMKKGVDIVVDSVGKETFSTSIRMLKKNGKLVTCGATTGPKTELDIRQIFWKQLEIMGSTMSNQQEFRDVMSLVLDGKLKPVIDCAFSLDRTADAEEYLKQGNQFGKVLIKIE